MPGLPRTAPTHVNTMSVMVSLIEIWMIAAGIAALVVGAIVIYRTKRSHSRAAIAPHDAGAELEPPAADDTRYCPVVASATSGGVGLVGPHAAAAARSVVVLLVTDHHSSVPGSTILTTRDTMAGLSPDAAIRTVPRLRMHDTLGGLMNEAFQALTARRDVPGPHPPLVIITDTAHEALISILEDGRHAGIGGIILGDGGFPRTFHVHSDGSLELVASARCGILSPDHFDACMASLTQAPLEDTVTDDTTAPSVATPAASRRHDISGETVMDAALSPQASGGAGVGTPLMLRLLGNIELHCHGQPARVSRIKAWELLAMIAAHPSGCNRNDLLETLVGDTVHSKARPHLNSLVSHTRRELRNITGDRDADFILRTTTGLCLDGEWTTSDVTLFDHHLTAADSTTDPEERASHLYNAVQLYRGPFCAGLLSDTTWYSPIRTYYQHAAHRAALTLADHRHSQGDLHASVAAFERAIGIDPRNRTAYERLVAVHRERGDATAAARAQRHLDALD